MREGMNENSVGNFAASKAGHDKKQVYVIVDQDEEYVYLSDGRLKPLSRPKKKNIKHIQIINRKVDRELLIRLMNRETIFDEQIKYAIKQYHKRRPKEAAQEGCSCLPGELTGSCEGNI